MLYIHIYQSPLGNIELFSDAKALVGLQFEGQKYAIHGSEVDASRPDLPISNKQQHGSTPISAALILAFHRL